MVLDYQESPSWLFTVEDTILWPSRYTADRPASAFFPRWFKISTEEAFILRNETHESRLGHGGAESELINNLVRTKVEVAGMAC